MDRSDDIARPGTHRAAAPSVALRTAVIGTIASLSIFGALGVLARREGRGTVAAINATSHVVHGARAGKVDGIDTAHTGVGSAINHGAAMFWAAPYTWWLSQRQNRPASQIALGTAATATLAGIVDYGLVPRRLSPGWEHAVPPRSVATTFGFLALGLALGGLVTRDLERR